MQEKSKKKSVVRIVICVLLALILIVGAAGLILIDGFLGLINRVGDEEVTLSSEELENLLSQTDVVDPEFTGPVLNPEDVLLPDVPVDSINHNDNIINVLLVGQDRRKGQSRMRSDAMIMCTINKAQKTLTMTSFLRDVWVRIPDRYDERLNVPYLVGGFPLLNETLAYNYGISADYNVEIDFFGFQAAIDVVGGVNVHLTAAEAAYINNPNKWEFKFTGSGQLVEGVNRLNSAEALMYSRIRSLDNDFGRTNRQRTVLTALINEIKNLNAGQLYQLAQSILPMITTDMTNAEILSCIIEIAPLLGELEIISQRIPVDNHYSFASIGGRSVIVLDEMDKAKAFELIENTMKK